MVDLIDRGITATSIRQACGAKNPMAVAVENPDINIKLTDFSDFMDSKPTIKIIDRPGKKTRGCRYNAGRILRVLLKKSHEYLKYGMLMRFFMERGEKEKWMM